MKSKRRQKLQSLVSGAIGNQGYITQPRVNVANVKGQIVISRNFPYKRRFQ